MSDAVKGESFILSNKIGGFLYLGKENYTTYNGMFFNHKFEIFKTVEDFVPEGEGKPLEVSFDGVKGERIYNNKREIFFMPRGFNALHYRITKSSKVKLVMDCRREYDRREFGRYYTIFEMGNYLVIKFRKVTDDKEDDSNGVEEYVVYTVLTTRSNKLPLYEVISEFSERFYAREEERGDTSRRHVYEALMLNGTSFVIASSNNLYSAIREVEYVNKNMKKLQQQYEKFDADLKDKEITKAYNLCQHTLDGFLSEIHHSWGMYAGYPWFFQFWTRDEGVSLKALEHIGRTEQAKSIVFARSVVHEDGRVNNRFPLSQLGSADGAGWVFLRFGDFLKYMDSDEKEFMKKRLESSIKKLQESYMYQGLVYNRALETWMDTDWNGDTREGYRIEIQCQMLAMLKLAVKLTKKKKYADAEKKLKNKVRKEFFNGKILADGKDDFTIRPNIFLAYYTYPQLLTKKEWETVFTRSLARLYLDWGGLASIDKTHSLFCKYHTGINNQSYHRGDSWFYVNNIAAMCLIDVNYKKFEKEIQDIVKASTEDILYDGITGYGSEISSAFKRESKGSPAQLWSNATFIELIKKT